MKRSGKITSDCKDLGGFNVNQTQFYLHVFQLEEEILKGKGHGMKKAKIGVKTFTMLCLTILTVLLLLRAGVVEAEEISVGIIGPMKFALGDHSWKGANIAADEINAAGGIKFGGKLHKVKLVQADDDCLTSIPNAVSAMKRLVNVNKVDFVVGGFRSEAVLAQQEVMADNKIIFLGTGSSAAEQNERLAKDFERYK